MGLKNITSKKLENGDTFATRIEEKKSPYYGQYLIFICFKDEFWFKYWTKSWYDEKHSTLFHIKITTDKKMPTNKEEINSLEYVISKVKCVEDAYYPLMSGYMTYEELVKERSFQELRPDEYGYLNEYLNEVWYSRKDPLPEFEYLGNFDIEKPKNEFISFGCDMHGAFFHQIIGDTLENYSGFNKHEYGMYTPEAVKNRHKQAKEELEFHVKTGEYIASLTEEEKASYQPKYILGWGPGLYECDVALDTKAAYLEVYEPSKSVPDIMNQVLPTINDFIKDQYDGPIAWMVLADLQMKRKKLDKRLRDTALDCIEIDLSYWQGNDQYEERKKELYKLKEKLKNSKIVRKKPKKKQASQSD